MVRIDARCSDRARNPESSKENFQMNKPLENKLALITGSSRGMGAATAIRLANDGASVIVNYAASAARADAVVEEIRRTGGKAEAVRADLTTLDGIAVLASSADTAFGGAFSGRVDILVNSAGTVEFGPFLESSQEAYDTHFNLNIRAPVELTKKLAPRMVQAGWGRIINISSAFGEAAPLAGVTLYIASKFALSGFTRGLSRELGPTGVTVNGIQPGPIDTELAPPPGTPGYDANVGLTSVGRYGKVEEIAAAIAFLCSPDAAFINGENLNVDGGWNA
ncbi:SDR family oxidoreductase [Gellertiella hungarica]|uniref:3-oxoacyl-[acyl-carrier protein] reductase n=1 Tax=Gellertiella hungarica TaxID=1572859 RepID=A0A7W6NMD0_9HYPH|nr:3-oxoacyl-[acyl-carrier protein] reductase [Gellertiella hungarica]